MSGAHDDVRNCCRQLRPLTAIRIFSANVAHRVDSCRSRQLSRAGFNHGREFDGVPGVEPAPLVQREPGPERGPRMLWERCRELRRWHLLKFPAHSSKSRHGSRPHRRYSSPGKESEMLQSLIYVDDMHTLMYVFEVTAFFSTRTYVVTGSSVSSFF